MELLGCVLGQARHCSGAVRFGKINPTGFCKQHSLCAAGECNLGICSKLLGFSRKDGFFQCFPGRGDPSYI